MSRYPPMKRRRLSPSEAGNGSEKGHNARQIQKNAAGWNLEQVYEQRARKAKSKGNGRLPIRTAEGWMEQETPTAAQDNRSNSFLGSDEEAGGDGEDGMGSEEAEEEPKISPKQQILDAKEDLARLAALINEDPEEHLGSFKSLAQIASSQNIIVKKLALATQCAVYKDIIPGYRIRPQGEEEMTAKVSKDVRRLRNYEQALVGGYQAYVRDLERYARTGKGPNQDVGLVSVALSCACSLLLAVPHFNFRGDLIKIVVSKLSGRRMDDDFSKCLRTLEELFQNDDDGHASLDAVSQLTKMIKARNYAVHESVLNTFLHLRLLSEFSSKGSHQNIDKNTENNEPVGKKPKEKRQYLSKRERKLRKEQKIVNKQMKEADAVVSHEERDKMQADMLKLVFVTYFRILKAKSAQLMGAVLEGLARYAHLINQEFFGDILEALKDLISSANVLDEEEDDDDDESEQTVDNNRNVSRESLLCVVTAFALLQGQDVSKSATALHLDLNFFITHLYSTLLPVALNTDIELGPKSLHLADPLATDSSRTHVIANKVNAQTTTVLLIRCLSSVLLPAAAIRSVPPLRIAAFTKQLLTASLHLPEKSCLAMLGLLTSTTKVHSKKIAGLWNTEERRGDGVFDPLREEVEGSNPFAGTVWEGELLRMHFCPKVRDAVKLMEKNIVDVQ